MNQPNADGYPIEASSTFPLASTSVPRYMFFFDQLLDLTVSTNDVVIGRMGSWLSQEVDGTA